ncbi:MAG: hypothetical protein AAFR74_04210, partial [Pseudomonadota bacterium]
MRSFLLLVFGLLLGAGGALTAANVSPTKEAITPYIDRLFSKTITSPLLKDEIRLSETAFTAFQLAPFAIEPCFPRQDAFEVSDKPWLSRDL